MTEFAKLQNGSDIRGVALPLAAQEPVNLTEEAVEQIARAFAVWLAQRTGRPAAELTIAVGRDSRLSGPSLQRAVLTGLTAMGATAADCGMASTPAMFMATVLPGCGFDGAVMITASHLPQNRNGLKFFTAAGGLESAEIRELLRRAEERPQAARLRGRLTAFDILTPYTELVDINELWAMPDGEEKEKRLAAIKSYRQMQMPMPDFVLCCNNICNCMTKWYENIARMHNIPLVMVDIPYNNTVEVDDAYVAYIRGQFDDAIKQLEKISGRKFDEKKFEDACAHANRTAKAWLKVCDYLQYKPAPYSGFDLFNHMADVVTARGRREAAEAFELLATEMEEHIKNGTTTTPFPEQFRVMFEGIPCWPKLPALFKPLKANGVNVTAVVYAPAFGFVYNNLDEMVRAYCKAPNSVCIEQGVDWREGICRDNKVDGVLVHYNRSCKPWSGYMAEMQRRFTKDLGVPTAGFDGDQADPRNFNAAQYETRVQGLVEAMQENKRLKEEGKA